MNNYLAIGSTLFFAGIFIFLNFVGLTNTSFLKGFAFLFMFYGLITIITLFQSGNRGKLFFATVFLNIGIILYVIENYEILNYYNIILPSILFVIGAGLFVVYLENLSEFPILVSALFFMVLSLIAILMFDNRIVQFAHRVTLIIFDYWPLFMILFGLVLILYKPKNSTSSGSSGRSINTSE